MTVTSLSLFTFMHWRRKWQPTPVFLPGESQGREPGGLSSMGSHRVGHDWCDLAAAAATTGEKKTQTHRADLNPTHSLEPSLQSRFVWWISADLQTHEWKMNSCFMSSCFKITHYASISVAVTVLSNLKIWEVYLEFGLIWRMVERIKSFSKFFSYYWNP